MQWKQWKMAVCSGDGTKTAAPRPNALNTFNYRLIACPVSRNDLVKRARCPLCVVQIIERNTCQNVRHVHVLLSSIRAGWNIALLYILFRTKRRWTRWRTNKLYEQCIHTVFIEWYDVSRTGLTDYGHQRAVRSMHARALDSICQCY